ncbi:MAG: SMC family ATPase [archaeon]|jgi:exonuclease SbcC
MIKSIILENWKTHQNTKINFNNGTNILVGKIGAGKSSIVDAICYSLFGSFPSLQNRKISLAENIMFKPIKRKEAKVTLEFDFDSKSYKIEREVFAEKVNTAKLFKDGKLVAGPKQTDVTDKVTEILGIDYDLFVKIVYSEQNEIDYFLKIAPAKRKEQFDNLFGIVHLEKIKENSRKVKSFLDTELDANQRLIRQLQTQLGNYDISETEKSILENKEKISLLLKATDELKQKGNSLKQELEASSKQKQQFDSLKQELGVLDYRLKQLINEITNLEKQKNHFFSFSKEQLLENKLVLQKQLKENQELDIKVKTLISQKIFFNNQLEILEKSLDSTLDISFITKQKEAFSEKLNQSVQEQSKLFSQKNENLKAIAELEKGFSNCPVCDSPLTVVQISDKLKVKEEQQKEVIENLSKLEKSLQETKFSLTQLQSQEKKANEQLLLKEKKVKLQEEKQKLEVEERQLGKPADTKVIEKDLENINLASDYQTKLVSQKEVLVSQQQLFQKLSVISYDENKYISLLTDNKSQEENIRNNDSQISLIQERIKDLEKVKEQHNQLSKQLLEKEQSIANLETKQKDMTFFGVALENSQEHLRKVLVDNINQTLDIIWPKVYPYGDYLSARLKAENDYVLEVLTLQKEWIRVEGLLSGGERTCAALSIRVAIALSLTKKLGLLILDEPTHNMDTKTISMLSTILEKDLPELVDQIFIITHDSKLLETINASKYIIERDKENDGVSFVKEE